MIKTEDKNFNRDPNSFALINTNEGEYLKRKQQKMQSRKVEMIEEEVQSLKDDIRELKEIILASMSR